MLSKFRKNRDFFGFDSENIMIFLEYSPNVKYELN